VTYAGTWVIGVNQVDRFLKAIEKGTGDEPPTVPMKVDPVTGENTINTDYDVWKDFPGITFTSETIVPTYLADQADADHHWYGIKEINYANKGYKQKEDVAIEFVQPSTVEWDYSGVPEGYSSLSNYFDRNDLSWLENIDLSGNDLTNILIDGGPYNAMPLKTVNLSNNPNLTTLSIVNCTNLEEVNLLGTGLTPEAFEIVKEGILESSPSANILYASNEVKSIKIDDPVIVVQGGNIVIKNKKVNDQVIIFDLSGRKIIETSNDVINANSIGKGVYMVKINNFVKKICL